MNWDTSHRDVNAHFAGKDIYVRSRGRHYHADLECPVIRQHPGTDIYHRSTFQLDEAGRLNLTNYDDIAYEPCRCATDSTSGG